MSDLNKPEVSYFDVTIFIDHNILGLQVTIDQVQEMQILQGEEYLSSVEAGVLLVEFAHSKWGISITIYLYNRLVWGTHCTCDDT